MVNDSLKALAVIISRREVNSEHDFLILKCDNDTEQKLFHSHCSHFISMLRLVGKWGRSIFSYYKRYTI